MPFYYVTIYIYKIFFRKCRFVSLPGGQILNINLLDHVIGRCIETHLKYAQLLRNVWAWARRARVASDWSEQ